MSFVQLLFWSIFTILDCIVYFDRYLHATFYQIIFIIHFDFGRYLIFLAIRNEFTYLLIVQF